MGTLSYASPEQLDDQMVDARSDVYSLGCVLFECLTGRPPFVGGLDAVIAAHIRQDPPKVTAFRPEVGPAIDDVIATALAKRPADRYQHAGELGAAAARALSLDRPWGPPPLPPTVVTPQPPAMPAPTPPSSAPPSSSPAPPPFPSSTAAAPPPPPSFPPSVTQGPTGSGPRPSNKKPFIIGGVVALVVLLAFVGVVIATSGGSDDVVVTTTTSDSVGTTTTTGKNSVADQQALLAHVPDAIQDSCHGESASAPAKVELGCTSADGKTFLLYDQYESRADLRAAYESQRSGIAIDSGDPSTGNCPGEGPLEGDNRITCEDRHPARWLHWTDDDLLIMSASSPFDDATPWPTLVDQVPELSPVGTRATP
jgi:Protein kinase domain